MAVSGPSRRREPGVPAGAGGSGGEDRPRASFPAPRSYGLLGAALLLVCWTGNWGLSGLRTHLLFFPQWLGYVLVVDALVARRSPPSMLQRNPRRWAALFLVSVPFWWLFEGVNAHVENWIYQGREIFSALEYFLLASLSFSTVVPAVFETAELVRTWPVIERLRNGPRLSLRPGSPAMAVSGLAMAVAVAVRPGWFFPFVWTALWFLLEPLNDRVGNRSLLEPLRRGDWRPVGSLALGCLACGFFWELWNWHSYPKWVYRVPFVDFLHVFEMPLLGYGGYPFFALELFAFYQLLVGVWPGPDPRWPRL